MVCTGVVSLLAGFLSVPPVLGLGTIVDVAILAGGLVVATARARTPRPSDSPGNP